MLIKNFTSDRFIRAYNSFSDNESEFYINDEEFYIYSLLFTNQMMDGSIRTNIDILHKLSWVKFIQDETKNKKKILNLISSLIRKNILIVENEFDKFKNNTMLEFSINNIEMSNDGIDEDKRITDETSFKNFTKIPYGKFLEFKSVKDLYIYYVVSRWSKGFKCSYENWAEILGYKHQESAIKIIDDAVKRGIVFKNIGDYESRTKQSANLYKISPFKDEVKSKQTKVKEQMEVLEEEIKCQQPHSSNSETRSHQWYTPRSDLTKVDFYIYLTTDDEELKKKAAKRIAIVSSSEKGKYAMDVLMAEAEYMLEQEEIKEQEELEFDILHSATNAVRLNDDTLIEVNASNIDKYNWTDVKELRWKIGHDSLSGTSRPSGLFGGGSTDDAERMDYGWELYRNLVKSGESLSMSTGDLIKDKVTKKFREKFNSIHSIVPDTTDLMNDLYTSEDVDKSARNKLRQKRKSAEELANEIF
jgi:hypothetical protein